MKIYQLLLLLATLVSQVLIYANTKADQNLLRAAAHGNLMDVKKALEADANMNAQDAGGSTALSLARDNNRIAVVDYLQRRGAK